MSHQQQDVTRDEVWEEKHETENYIEQEDGRYTLYPPSSILYPSPPPLYPLSPPPPQGSNFYMCAVPLGGGGQGGIRRYFPECSLGFFC